MQFRIDPQSGVPAYLQLVQQTRQALRLGLLQPGDRMPTIREVVAQLGINPNTVQKAWRELELAGLIGGKPGAGTYVLATLPGPDEGDLDALREGLLAWTRDARARGLDDEGLRGLFAEALRATDTDTEAP